MVNGIRETEGQLKERVVERAEILCPLCGCICLVEGNYRNTCEHLIHVNVLNYIKSNVGKGIENKRKKLLRFKDVIQVPLVCAGIDLITTSVIEIRTKPRFPWRLRYEEVNALEVCEEDEEAGILKSYQGDRQGV